MKAKFLPNPFAVSKIFPTFAVEGTKRVQLGFSKKFKYATSKN